MIIKSLQLYNFGIYAGENIFEFFQKKPIVLIGGMNGRGKTTFLEGIVLSLYGNNSAAYKESGHKSYGQYLRSLVNRDSWDQRTFVELTLVMNDENNTEYTVHREWNALEKKVVEKIDVSENGVYNEFLTNNWGMFVENIIPSALSNFYFFDGEKIAELALDEKNTQLKAAIRTMLGINVLDVLRNDLNKSLRRRSKMATSSSTLEKIQEVKQQKEKLSEEIIIKEEHIQAIETTVLHIQAEINGLQNQFESKGGKVVELRATSMNERAELVSSLEQIQNELINVAAGELPLLLVKDLIQEIKLQAEDEHDEMVMHQLIERIDVLLQDYLAQQGVGHDECKKFVQYIKQQSDDSVSEPIYQVSEFALFQLNSLLDGALARVKQETVGLLERKKELQKKLIEVESHLSLDINENMLSEIVDSIKEKQSELVETQVKYNKELQELKSLKTSLNIMSVEVDKTVDEYLKKASLVDENSRMDKYTNIALRILDEYSIQLQSKKSGVLARTITECYHKLANKQNLIKDIKINSDSLEITYYGYKGEPIQSKTLSAGEKQLMVIAVLWALAICSKKRLPVIIDTPLSRLDSSHRASVVKNYFPNASDQTMILSTDSEIDRTYYDMMKDSIGDEFTLKYDEDTHSTTIVKGYFGK